MNALNEWSDDTSCSALMIQSTAMVRFRVASVFFTCETFSSFHPRSSKFEFQMNGTVLLV
jgi:hypothetical protein